MKAKTASKILNEHLEGNQTDISKKMFSEIATKLIASGVEPPFGIKNIKVAQGHLDHFDIGPQVEEDPDFPRHDVGPDIEEFEKGSSEKVIVPKDLALQIMDWHGGQRSAIYGVASTAFAGKPVSLEDIDDAIRELESNLRGVPEISNDRQDLVSAILSLKTIVSKNNNEKDVKFETFPQDGIDDLPM